MSSEQTGDRLVGDLFNAPSKRRLEPFTYDRHHSFRHGGARIATDADQPTVTSGRTSRRTDISVIPGVSVSALWKTANTWTVSSSWVIDQASVQNLPTTYKTRLYIEFNDLSENTTHDLPNTFNTSTESLSHVVSGIGAPGARSGTCRIEFIDESTNRPFGTSADVLVYFNDPTIQSLLTPMEQNFSDLWNKTPLIRIPVDYVNVLYPGSVYNVYAQLATNVTATSPDIFSEKSIYTGTDLGSIANTNISIETVFAEMDIYKSRRLRFRIQAVGADASVYSQWTERFCFPPNVYLGSNISCSLVPSYITGASHRLQLDNLTIFGSDHASTIHLQIKYTRFGGTTNGHNQHHTANLYSISSATSIPVQTATIAHSPTAAVANERFGSFRFYVSPTGWLSNVPRIASSGYFSDWGLGITGNVQTDLYYPAVSRLYVNLYGSDLSNTATYLTRVTCHNGTVTNFPDTDNFKANVLIGLSRKAYPAGATTAVNLARTERISIFDPTHTLFAYTPDSVTESPGVYWGPRTYTHTSTQVYGVPSAGDPVLLYTAPAEHLSPFEFHTSPGVSSFTVEIQNTTSDSYDIVLTSFDGFTAFTANDVRQYYTFRILITDSSAATVINTVNFDHPRPASINWYPVSSSLPYTILTVNRNNGDWFGFGGGIGAQTHNIEVKCGYFHAGRDMATSWVPEICGDAVRTVVANVPAPLPPLPTDGLMFEVDPTAIDVSLLTIPAVINHHPSQDIFVNTTLTTAVAAATINTKSAFTGALHTTAFSYAVREFTVAFVCQITSVINGQFFGSFFQYDAGNNNLTSARDYSFAIEHNGLKTWHAATFPIYSIIGGHMRNWYTEPYWDYTTYANTPLIFYCTYSDTNSMTFKVYRVSDGSVVHTANMINANTTVMDSRNPVTGTSAAHIGGNTNADGNAKYGHLYFYNRYLTTQEQADVISILRAKYN